jgi:hypothetical protein
VDPSSLDVRVMICMVSLFSHIEALKSL